ncbi:nuclear transport factor 2 family protein [Sphingobium chlorophenolicum]|uniref:Small subunit of phenylpropionate dioxygenase n=1 Tax=Sphingobium chlorophenolicum TaxID=46429 RepID=A0A081RFA9_SPHCR|nr:nuclear transport factor 2 family protein [Sphingobium chlorophenolicum]KEQ53882.1 Small subunit of phenylpropionate dioxygenase precursor [Sphingobium chlorophenolicum]
MTGEDKLSMLWDERVVTKRLLHFGRSLDLGDWQGWRSCFTDRIGVDFKRLLGQDEVRIDADLWVEMVERALSPVRRHHTYTNFNITFDGDRAHAVVYMTARHWAATDIGVSHNTQYGWYDFHLIRRDPDWLIDRYKHDFQWVDGNSGILDVHDPALSELSSKIFTEENFEAARQANRG